jgi:hypothetical protein
MTSKVRVAVDLHPDIIIINRCIWRSVAVPLSICTSVCAVDSLLTTSSFCLAAPLTPVELRKSPGEVFREDERRTRRRILCCASVFLLLYMLVGIWAYG